MPKLTVDGQELEAAPGTTLLQAALERGREIPHYCYHPGLPLAGNCRMCLVEVEKAPKLVIACATTVADGMVVHTRSERVKRAQAAVMEFLLINHPLDCTICDQAGECRLQEYAVEYGTGRSRYEDPKLLLGKAVDIGAHVMLDQERCIQCSRCTRFCDEVTRTGELAFFQRGERTIIGIYPGRRLDNPYSGNVVDLCPVGALTLKEFRFETRVWYLKHTPSVCAGCARGCNVVVAVGRQGEMWTTRGQFDDRIKRIVPRANEDVNRWWICDEGRLSYRRVELAERLLAAGLAPGGEPGWEPAVAAAAASLAEAARAGRAAALLSPRLTTETMFAWRRLFEELGGVRVGVTRLVRGKDDGLLIRADKGANSRGAEWIFGPAAEAPAVLEAASRGELDALLVAGDVLDPEDTARIDGLQSKVRHRIYVGPFLDAAAREASILLPAAAWAEEEGSYASFEGRIQWVRRCHLPRGEGRPGWRVAVDLARQAGVALPAWASAREVLAALAEQVGPYAGLSAERIGLLGVRAATAHAAPRVNE
jgi:NADH-quinone oxidoreductase subunit G